jgi:hypothetical protein
MGSALSIILVSVKKMDSMYMLYQNLGAVVIAQYYFNEIKLFTWRDIPVHFLYPILYKHWSAFPIYCVYFAGWKSEFEDKTTSALCWSCIFWWDEGVRVDINLLGDFRTGVT